MDLRKLKALLHFPTPGLARNPPGMTKAESAVIKSLAEGDQTRRQEAIDIHRRYLPILGINTPEMRFMSEIDNPCPDLSLRSRYRVDLLTGED